MSYKGTESTISITCAHRTHTCGQLTTADIGKRVCVSGWVDTVRDHGGVKFVDLRDHYGVTQVVLHDDALLDGVGKECVISAEGVVEKRDDDKINTKLVTGEVEVKADKLTLLGGVRESLPFEIGDSRSTREDIRLKYRFLDLRNPEVHNNIILRSKVISFMRQRMKELGFLEIQTPILTSSSPEGARDYIIPSRKHKGKFYALPQAPQIFKQLLMVSGFDRYFQIAPCFRDEDARADRSPGEFYQLDFEMAFASQEDVFAVAENVLSAVFAEFSDKKVDSAPFVKIPYREAMKKYGTDKPDLRNPLEIVDLSEFFQECTFAPFKGKTVRSITADNCADKSKKFFEEMLAFANGIGMPGLGYIKVGEDMSLAGPIVKFIPEEKLPELVSAGSLKPGSVIFFISDSEDKANEYAGQIRTELGKRLELIDSDSFRFCFITDFPMYEYDETGAVAFTHNPFSMPQGGLEALMTKEPTTINAYQYDIVCNGIELSSGAVRNHDIDIMVKAFEIAGYPESEIQKRFPALYGAFKYGAPPHAGMAPGVDRILMLLCGEENIREVIAFPMNGNAQDLLMGAPCDVTEKQLREAHIKLR